MLNIPHAVSLAQKEKILYVADRENYRVLSYNSSTGTFVKIFAEELSARIFSVAFSNTNNSKTKSKYILKAFIVSINIRVGFSIFNLH